MLDLENFNAVARDPEGDEVVAMYDELTDPGRDLLAEIMRSCAMAREQRFDFVPGHKISAVRCCNA